MRLELGPPPEPPVQRRADADPARRPARGPPASPTARLPISAPASASVRTRGACHGTTSTAIPARSSSSRYGARSGLTTPAGRAAVIQRPRVTPCAFRKSSEGSGRSGTRSGCRRPGPDTAAGTRRPGRSPSAISTAPRGAVGRRALPGPDAPASPISRRHGSTAGLAIQRCTTGTTYQPRSTRSGATASSGSAGDRRRTTQGAGCPHQPARSGRRAIRDAPSRAAPSTPAARVAPGCRSTRGQRPIWPSSVRPALGRWAMHAPCDRPPARRASARPRSAPRNGAAQTYGQNGPAACCQRTSASASTETATSSLAAPPRPRRGGG